MAKTIGILTAGGDSPGLNAAIRAIGKAAIRSYGMTVVGFRDGFRGLMQNRYLRLDSDSLSRILTVGGTILGTGRDKPHRMEVGGEVMDVTTVMLENAAALGLDALVAIGGGGTHKNIARLTGKGLPFVTLPKTIDNDVARTDTSIGFDTALGIATEAVDRLHSTAHSHHRIMVVEIMGHNAGWLTLGAGLAGGADVILIPEIAYDIDSVAASISERKAAGSTFSIVAVAEGARPLEYRAAQRELFEAIDAAQGHERDQLEADLAQLRADAAEHTVDLAHELEQRTGLESRVTILGHVQRGGPPSPNDRQLATVLGIEAARLVDQGVDDVMVAIREGIPTPVPLSEVSGERKVVPPDHPWVTSARRLEVSFGD
jgi:ATP-dependent phosphofructokinase / diphosphate-dependent phosphofructokinase